jgi:hypothetical protein
MKKMKSSRIRMMMTRINIIIVGIGGGITTMLIATTAMIISMMKMRMTTIIMIAAIRPAITGRGACCEGRSLKPRRLRPQREERAADVVERGGKHLVLVSAGLHVVQLFADPRIEGGQLEAGLVGEFRSGDDSHGLSPFLLARADRGLHAAVESDGRAGAASAGPQRREGA